MVNADGIPSIYDDWEVKEIVYVAFMSPLMLMALLEWVLWVAAFLYCLTKVFIKAERWHIRVLAVIMMILFTAFRCAFLPVMVVTLPLPGRITQYFPRDMVAAFQWFAFYTFAALLIIPWLFCVYQLITTNLGRAKRIKTVLDESTAPKVVIVMPCYNEVPEVLMTAIDSIVDGDYPPSCQHIFLSFDGAEENELYLKTIESLGVPLSLASYPPSLDVTYRGLRITVSRFKHGGKRHCQKLTYRLIDKIYKRYLEHNDNLFILFIDSDCILDKVCIQNFVYEMELKPGSKRDMLAMTGVITATAEKQSFITLLQDIEYVHGQLFERSVESACGAVTCLPGALTILRFSAFREMAKYYFADKAEQCDDLFDFGKCHLGEDRWLTHLFMIGAKKRYQIQMCTGAFCKTESVLKFRSLLKQRRRWFLGFITNEVCMLTDIRLWRRYPILCIVRFMQNTIRTTALLFFIMVLSLITTTQKVENLPVGFIAVSLGLNWALMIYFGIRLHRFKAWLYPIMFVVNPFFNWMYMVYGIFTAGQRTWGGPRADAGKADEGTTAQEAIEQAEVKGDDLQVVPETFKFTAQQRATGGTLHPSDSVEGIFAIPERDANGLMYQHPRDSIATLPDVIPRNPNVPRIPLHPQFQHRDSMESINSVASTTATQSIYMPRRVESIMGDEDRTKYFIAQANQREAGGAYLEVPRANPLAAHIQERKEEVYGYAQEVGSQDSFNSAYRGYSAGSNRPFQTETAGQSAPTSEGNMAIPMARLTQPPNVYIPDRPSSQFSPISARSPLSRPDLVRVADEDVEQVREFTDSAPSTEPFSEPPSEPSSEPPSGPSSGEERRSRSRSRDGKGKKLQKKKRGE